LEDNPINTIISLEPNSFRPKSKRRERRNLRDTASLRTVYSELPTRDVFAKKFLIGWIALAEESRE
jgi:hypothetical protein